MARNSKIKHHGNTIGQNKTNGQVTNTTPTPISLGNPYKTIVPVAYNVGPKSNLAIWSPSALQSSVIHAGTSKGYDITAMRLNKNKRTKALARANGYLSDGKYQYPFFITGIDIDWSISGDTAQAHLTRDMYPHNFVQPVFTIQGISLDQQDYGELCEFVRYMQYNAINGGPMIQLNVLSKGLSGGKSLQGTDKRELLRGVHIHSGIIGDQALPNERMRGRHRPIITQGFIGSMLRQHSQGTYAPTWSFSFITAAMIQGPYSEDLVQLQRQANWIDVVNSTSTLVVNKALLSENSTNLAWVAANSANFLSGFQNSSAGNSSSSNTSNSSSSGGSGTGAWQTTIATYFTDTTYSCGGSPSTNNGMLYAELNNGQDATGGLTNPGLAPLFGVSGSSGLPCGYKLEVMNPANGKSQIAVKQDIGTGAPGAAIDLYLSLANAIGFTSEGKGPVKIRKAQ